MLHSRENVSLSLYKFVIADCNIQVRVSVSAAELLLILCYIVLAWVAIWLCHRVSAVHFFSQLTNLQRGLCLRTSKRGSVVILSHALLSVYGSYSVFRALTCGVIIIVPAVCQRSAKKSREKLSW